MSIKRIEIIQDFSISASLILHFSRVDFTIKDCISKDWELIGSIHANGASAWSTGSSLHFKSREQYKRFNLLMPKLFRMADCMFGERQARNSQLPLGQLRTLSNVEINEVLSQYNNNQNLTTEQINEFRQMKIED